jgi:hypothetical protein
MLIELESQYRRIFTDGRSHPDDYLTTRMGHSIGHWEGDTLVIETRLLSEDLFGRRPRTESMVVTERVSLMKLAGRHRQRRAATAGDRRHIRRLKPGNRFPFKLQHPPEHGGQPPACPAVRH